MAGSPKKRERRLAIEAAAAAERAGAASARAATTGPAVEPVGAGSRAHGHVRQAPPTAPTPVGSDTRHHFDKREASDFQQLTEQLEPGIIVRILRTRPTWAEGWIEDFELDDGDLSELMHHIRSEHGGQRFRVQVLGRDNRVLYQAKVPIAGPVRRDGKVVTRDQWESGSDTPHRDRAERERQQQPAAAATDPLAAFRLMLDMQKESGAQIATALKEMREGQTEQTQRLVDAVVETRKHDAGSTLGAQLGELVKVTRQVDEIRADFAASGPQPPAAPEPVDPIKAATVEIFKTAIQNEFAMRQNRQAPQQQQGAPQPPRRRQQRPMQQATQQHAPRQQQRPTNGQGRRPSVETITPKAPPGTSVQ